MKIYDAVEQIFSQKGLISQNETSDQFRELVIKDNKIWNIQGSLNSIPELLNTINNPFYVLQKNLGMIVDQFNNMNNLNFVSETSINIDRKMK